MHPDCEVLDVNVVIPLWIYIYTCAAYRYLNHPKNFQFPQHSFGVKKPEQRSFQPSWFNSRLWLYYFICVCWPVYKEICTSKSKQLIHFDGYSTEKTLVHFVYLFENISL